MSCNSGYYYGGGYYEGWPGWRQRYNLTRYLLSYPGVGYGYYQPYQQNYDWMRRSFLPFGYGGFTGAPLVPYGGFNYL